MEIFSKLPSSGTSEWWSCANHVELYTQGTEPAAPQPKQATDGRLTDGRQTDGRRSDGRKIERMPAMKYAVQIIDEMAMLYTESMMSIAVTILKQRWMEWITSEIGSKYFGPKKSRFILSWLSGNRLDQVVGEKIISEFLRWMLDDDSIHTECHKGIVMVVMKN